MKRCSWIILVVLGAVTLLISLNSLRIAYSSAQDHVGSASITELSVGRPDVATAVRARRATAAAYAAGFATLFIFIALGPYRRGDVWAWWALAAGMAVVAGLVLLRIPLLGIGMGTPAAGTARGSIIQLAIAAAGLAIGAGRFKGKV